MAARFEAPTIGLLPSAEGRLVPISSYQHEWKLAVGGAREIALYAGERGVAVAIEPLNRYEAFLVNRVSKPLAFGEEVGVVSTGIVADFLHMNIEEADLGAALVEKAKGRLLEIHLADSNRRGLGHGQLPLERLLSVAGQAGFGAYVMEFTATNDAELDGFLDESAEFVRKERP